MGRTVTIIVVTFAVILHSTAVLCKSVVGILHAGCPFPGIPKNGEGKVNKVHNLTPSSNITFNETDVIDYTCSSGWMNSTENHTNITCQHDGVWTGEVPKCRNYVISSHLKNIAK
jgi:Sushi repeat (SCR repeat)